MLYEIEWKRCQHFRLIVIFYAKIIFNDGLADYLGGTHSVTALVLENAFGYSGSNPERNGFHFS